MQHHGPPDPGRGRGSGPDRPRGAERIAPGLALAAALAFGGCVASPSDLGAPETLDCPAGPGSQSPNLALGLDGRLYLSWIEPDGGGHALRFSTWDAGRWSAPRIVARGEDWFVNWADLPSLTALADGTLAAHWLVKSDAETYAYDVLVTLSRDGGTRWLEPIRPHRDGTRTEHGFVSLVPISADRLGIVWLDGRRTATAPRGPMTLRHAVLRTDGTLELEAVIDDCVCDCCPTSAIRTGEGATLVAYRDRSPTEIRDISVSRLSESGWSAPWTVHADGWETGACPVNGPALDGSGESVAIAWFTGAGDDAVVRVAFSRDGGRSFAPPIRIDEGQPLGRVDVALVGDEEALVSWIERDADAARLMVRPVGAGRLRAPARVATLDASRSSGTPRMARLEDALFFAWTEPGEPSTVRTARLGLPR